jgi:hypothetical protein
VTAGLRAATSAGRLEGHLRGGLGWGRTGGFGNTIRQGAGAYLDKGQWVPIESSVDIGAGSPASGFAYSAATGLEVRVTGPLRCSAEVGLLGLHLTCEDLLMVPVRMGFALR